MMSSSVLTLMLVCLAADVVWANTDKVVCYWGSWSHYRWGNARFTVNDINPYLCTHLIYGFVGLQPDGNVILLNEYLDVDAGNFQKFNNLKKENPNLKTLVAIGGWNQGSENYSLVASDPVRRSNLINTATDLVLTWGFDGFDLDWEYPNQRGGAYEDIQNYAILIKEFREVFDKHGLLLTAAVAAAGPSVDLSYDVPALSRYLDFINVMAYDLHGSWETVTGQNAPLYPSKIDIDDAQRQLNVDAAIRGWISRGADPQKIILGLGFYGRTYTLSTTQITSLGASISGSGNPGKYTGERGFVGYHEIIELQNAGDWTTVWDDEQKTPYTYKGNQWIGYDNPRSISIKVDYAVSLNLGGVMVWSIDTDDFKGLSGTKYQLLTTISKVLNGEEVEPDAGSQPETEKDPQPEPEAKPESEPEGDSKPGSSNTNLDENSPICTSEGYSRDPNDCAVYYYCQLTSNGFNIAKQTCYSGLVYDAEQNICNYPALVQC